MKTIVLEPLLNKVANLKACKINKRDSNTGVTGGALL